MSSSRSTIEPYALLNAASLNTDQTSPATNLKRLDSGCLTIETTGTPTGQIYVEISNDAGLVSQPNWYSLPGVTIQPLTGGADTHIVNLNTIDFPWIRVRYARTSGTGTITATISAKGR